MKNRNNPDFIGEQIIVHFTEEQKEKIKKYINPFKEYLNSEEGKKLAKEILKNLEELNY